MAHWLLKSEPVKYPWEQMVKDGRTHWDGVHNFQAALNMRRITVWYTAGLPRSKSLRVNVCRTTSSDEIRTMIEDYFNALPSDVPAPCAPVLLSE